MKLRPLLLAALLLTTPPARAASHPFSPALTALDPALSARTRLIAHRGLSAQAPENTLPAIQLAAAYGLAGCEMDIYPTEDGVWVLNHDPSVDAMTDGTGFIQEMTWAELSQLRVDAGSNVGRYPGLGLCRLEDALDACAEGDITPVIEVKAASYRQLDALADLLRQKNWTRRCVVLSYDYDILRYLRTGGDAPDLYWLVSAVSDETVALAAALPNTGLDFWTADPANTHQAIQTAQNAGIPLIAWTADAPEAVERLAALGVTQVTTNALVPHEDWLPARLK